MKDLFFKFDGRISRKTFWFGTLIIFAVAFITSLVLVFVIMASLGLDEVERLDREGSPFMNLVIFLLFAVPSAALLTKRYHDRGGSAQLVILYFGLVILSLIASSLGIVGVTPEGEVTSTWGLALFGLILPIGGMILGLYFLVVCGFLKGIEGPNQYGPDPLA